MNRQIGLCCVYHCLFLVGFVLLNLYFFCVVLCISLFVFSEVCVAQSLVFCVVLCISLFVFSGVCVAQSLLFCVVLCISLFVFSGVCVTQSH